MVIRSPIKRYRKKRRKRIGWIKLQKIVRVGVKRRGINRERRRPTFNANAV
jgi:hypothetical protein